MELKKDNETAKKDMTERKEMRSGINFEVTEILIDFFFALLRIDLIDLAEFTALKKDKHIKFNSFYFTSIFYFIGLNASIHVPSTHCSVEWLSSSFLPI